MPDDPPPRGAPGDDLTLPGGRVRVATEDFAQDPVEGELVHATRETIAIRRDDSVVGRVHVHFPRLGYQATGRAEVIDLVRNGRDLLRHDSRVVARHN